MFFEKELKQRVKNVWLRLNIQAVLVGLLIGLILNAFFSVIRNELVWNRIIMTFLFSYTVTAAITNTIALAQRLTNRTFKSKWTIPIIYYSSLFLGMVIGTEFTYIVLSFVYKNSYQFLAHTDDLMFNLIVAIVVGSIVYVRYNQRDQMEFVLKENEFKLGKMNELKTKAELQALQSKINPHFLYNALNSIASLIHDQPNEAEEMTIKLSKLFRYSLNSSDENFSTLAEELEIVKLYLDIEKIRFQHKLSVEIDVTDEILNCKVPRFLIQPLVENSIKHGIDKLKNDGIIIIKCTVEDKKVILSIHDNGPYFESNYQAGYGLQSTFDKLNLLYNDLYEIHINNGLYKEVKIMIPLQNEI